MMDDLIRAGGLYGVMIANQPAVPLHQMLQHRPASVTFADHDMVVIHGHYEADLVMCLPMDDELDVGEDGIAAAIVVLERGGILVIHGVNPYAPGAVFQSQIQPMLGGGHA